MSSTSPQPASQDRPGKDRVSTAATYKSLGFAALVALVSAWFSTTHWWWILPEFGVWAFVPVAHLAWSRSAGIGTRKRTGSPLLHLGAALGVTAVAMLLFHGHVDSWEWSDSGTWLITQGAGFIVGFPIVYVLGFGVARAGLVASSGSGQSPDEATRDASGAPFEQDEKQASGPLPRWAKLRLWVLLPLTGWVVSATPWVHDTPGTTRQRGMEGLVNGILFTLGAGAAGHPTALWCARGFAVGAIAVLVGTEVIRRRSQTELEDDHYLEALATWAPAAPGTLPAGPESGGPESGGPVDSPAQPATLAHPAPDVPPAVVPLSPTAAGWYRTADGRYWRWFDGQSWTDLLHPVQ